MTCALVSLLLFGGLRPARGQDPPEREAQAEAEAPAPEAAPDSPPLFFEHLDVVERADDLVGIAGSASEGSTGHEDLARRPLLRTGELVETVPGAIATQHSGGGKANQYFLRGFNLDHGTDFAISVDGMPVNMPSHGHGQGYADLNFLIPELIDRVEYVKGTHAAARGDFSAAGSAAIRLRSSLPQGLLSVDGGSFGHARALVADTLGLPSGQLTGGLELYRDDGPWVRPDDYERANGLLRLHTGDLTRGFTLTAMGHGGRWLATDQVPRRAIRSGRIDRLGLIDPGPRGRTSRFSLSAERRQGRSDAWSRVTAFASRHDFELFSNFTYLLDDPAQGDQFEQRDRRWVFGLAAERHAAARWGNRPLEWSAGLQLRHDAIRNGLFRTRELERLAATREDDIRQWTGGAYAELLVRWGAVLRTRVGVRADGYAVDVASDRPENSGDRRAAILSPKLSLIAGPWRETELYLNAGLAHHSNDARGATIRVDPATGERVERVDPLVRARGVDLGLRSRLLPALQSTLAFFYLELDSEILFVGDAGATEAGRPSRRLGVEWANHLRLGRWLFADLDVSLSRARFTDPDPAGERIPGSLSKVVAASLSAEGARLFGGLRLRYAGGYPLIEDGSVSAGTTAMLSGRLGYRLGDGLRVRVEGFNLLGREDSDIEYYYASRLEGEPPEGVEDVHLHPAQTPSLRVGLDWSF